MGNRNPKKHSRKSRRGKGGRFVKGPQKGETTSEMVNYETAPSTEAPRESAQAHPIVAARLPRIERALAVGCVDADEAFAAFQSPGSDLALRKPWLRRAWEWLMGEGA